MMTFKISSTFAAFQVRMFDENGYARRAINPITKVQTSYKQFKTEEKAQAFIDSGKAAKFFGQA